MWQEFDWIAQLRYYWRPKDSIILKETGKANTVDKCEARRVSCLLGRFSAMFHLENVVFELLKVAFAGLDHQRHALLWLRIPGQQRAPGDYSSHRPVLPHLDGRLPPLLRRRSRGACGHGQDGVHQGSRQGCGGAVRGRSLSARHLFPSKYVSN